MYAVALFLLYLIGSLVMAGAHADGRSRHAR